MDYTKVHEINFQANYFTSRGPLNMVPSPQGKPTIIQAGGSPKGRRFAAKHADCVITPAHGLEEMKAFRDDIRSLAAAQGRNPDDVKVMYLFFSALGVDEADARAKYKRYVEEPTFVQALLALSSAITDIDFSKYDLDKPLPKRLITNGEQTGLDMFQN